jgi:hypothetical protein
MERESCWKVRRNCQVLPLSTPHPRCYQRLIHFPMGDPNSEESPLPLREMVKPIDRKWRPVITRIRVQVERRVYAEWIWACFQQSKRPMFLANQAAGGVKEDAEWRHEPLPRDLRRYSCEARIAQPRYAWLSGEADHPSGARPSKCIIISSSTPANSMYPITSPETYKIWLLLKIRPGPVSSPVAAPIALPPPWDVIVRQSFESHLNTCGDALL